MKKVLFIGGREKGYKVLETILEEKGTVVYALVLKEDDHEPENYSSSILELCKKNNIKASVGKSTKGKEEEIKSTKPDIIIVAGWRTLLPSDIISLPKKGTVALHESLLPKYRGFAPINWAVINGEKETGVTLFYLDNETDHGEIIGQEKIRISKNESAYDVYKKSIVCCQNLIRKYLKEMLEGNVKAKKQVESQATYACARLPQDGKINWNESSKMIHDLVRGLSYPYPGAYCDYNGETIIIEETSIVRRKKWVGSVPGRIASFDKKNGVEVLTGDGSIFVKTLRNGSEKVPALTFLTSVKGTLI